VRHQSVEFLLGILVLVSLSLHLDTDASWASLDTLGPDVLVQLGLKTDIASLESLSSELLDLLNSAGSALLEAPMRESELVRIM
jgi:hypothetical protein